MREALELRHPFQGEPELSADLRRACDRALAKGSSLNEWRHEQWSKLRQMAESFNVSPGCPAASSSSQVSKTKAPLFKFLLRHYGYDDVGAADLCLGAPILGEMGGPSEWPLAEPPRPSLYAEDQPPPLWSGQEILAENEGARNVFLHSIRPSKFDCTLLEASEADRRAGLLEGPFFNIVDIPFSRCAIARRFGVDQGDKVRECDDFSLSGVNRGFRCLRKLKLANIDSFCELAAYQYSNLPRKAPPPAAGPLEKGS